jgi:hypothetical protein
VTLRACFAALADGLHADLTTDNEHRLLYEYHSGRIRSIFAANPDLPLHQDSVGGFLHGFLVTGAHYVSEDTVEQQTMFPVLGGTLLLARDLPIGPPDLTAGRGFIDRLAATVADTDPAPGTALVHQAFDIAGDIPVTCATLGAFSLGVAYTVPYLPADGDDPTTLIAAACQLARILTR